MAQQIEGLDIKPDNLSSNLVVQCGIWREPIPIGCPWNSTCMAWDSPPIMGSPSHLGGWVPWPVTNKHLGYTVLGVNKGVSNVNNGHFFFRFLILNIWLFCLHVWICIMHMPGACRSEKRVSSPLELELEWLWTTCKCWNCTLVLCKTNKCS